MSTITLSQPAKSFLAIRWTGDNLRDVQDFMLPSSPLRVVHDGTVSTHADYKPSRVSILVPDPIATKMYLSLGPQFKLVHIELGDWILATPEGEFTSITNVQARELAAGSIHPDAFADLTPVAEKASV